eukprot:4238559-Pyramimonas_sp.AAC.1
MFFAGDLAASPSDLVSALPRVVRVPVQSGSGAGRLLNLKKCQLAFPDADTCRNALRLRKGAGIRVRSFKVCCDGWHLDAGIGISGAPISWGP